jgi:predicted GNAT family acetyltransferase
MEYIHEKERIYALGEGGEVIAQVDFPEVGGDTVSITRTFVDPSLRGQGVADALVRGVYDEMKAQNKSIQAVCSYAVKWFEEHPEKRDLLKEQ